MIHIILHFQLCHAYLGRLQKQNSGFGDGPWVEGWDILDNEFYHLLLDNKQHTRRALNWTQFQVNSTDNVTRHEWRNMGGRENLIMLNSDIALVLNISDKLDGNNGGECPCRYHSCGANEVGKVWVEAYADDNQLWLTDFGAAFRKMILTGYDASDLEILAEDWYYDHYCFLDDVKSYTQVFTGVSAFRERRDGPAYINATSYDFVSDHPECGDTNFEYYYDLTYLRKRKRLTVRMEICCGQDAIFHDDYIPPNGYSFVGTGEAFIGDIDGDGDIDNDDIKQLIVIIVCNLAVIVCCISVCYVYWKYSKKRSAGMEIEKKTVDLQANTGRASMDGDSSYLPNGQANIQPHYSEETFDPVTITSM